MTQPDGSRPPAIARTALALAVIAFACASTPVWIAAWRAVEQHGYGELGYARNAYLTLRAASKPALEAGIVCGLVVGVAFAVAALVLVRLGASARAAGVLRALASPAIVAWTVVGIALCATASLVLVRNERDWIGERDIGHVVVYTILCALVLLALSRSARRSASAESGATIVAASAATLVIAPVWFRYFQSSMYGPADGSTWILRACAAALAAVLFLWVRGRARADLHGRQPRWSSGPIAVGALLALLVALAPFAMLAVRSSSSAPTLVAKQPFNVLVLAIDTLRHDEMSLFGNNPRGRDTTPNLRRLAERGVVFENAVSQAPWTLPAFASILTGKYPHEHGAYSIVGRLRERETTIAEVLREAGYHTIGVGSQVHLERGNGFEQGCEVYDDSAMTSEHRINGDRTSDAALRALAGVDASKPFFAFVHWFDPHSEYVDHEDQHWADGYDGWLRTQLEYDNLERNRQMLDAADMKYVLDVYDEETAFTDEQIGRVLDALDERGLTEKTLIVLCVDHGEQFLEHGGFGHTTTLYDELIRVPLIVVPPGSKAGSRRADVVETCAVFGTVLGALGIQSADGVDQRWSAHQAHSLLTLPRDPAEPAFSIVWLPDSKASSGKQLCLSAIRSGRWKLVRDWTRGKRMLFDLESDPRELTDRSGDQPELSARLSQELDDWTKRQREIGGEASRRTLDANTAAALRNLGYLGDDKQ